MIYISTGLKAYYSNSLRASDTLLQQPGRAGKRLFDFPPWGMDLVDKWSHPTPCRSEWAIKTRVNMAIEMFPTPVGMNRSH